MKEFWESQAEKFKEDVRAVSFDPLAEDLELFFVEKLIRNNELFCDVGCGNGRTVISLASKKNDTIFYGVDFSKGMIEIANAKKRELNMQNVHFHHIDAISKDLPTLFETKFDKILTKRLLINLKGDDKFKALDNIYSMLKDNGTYIMIECFTEPLQKINKIRERLNLEEIKVKFFNEYLSLDIFEKISDRFSIERKIDFESLYYFTSRIFNAYLSEGKPDYHAPINKLSVELIKMGINPIEGYSPEIIFLLRKK